MKYILKYIPWKTVQNIRIYLKNNYNYIQVQ